MSDEEIAELFEIPYDELREEPQEDDEFDRTEFLLLFGITEESLRENDEV